MSGVTETSLVAKSADVDASGSDGAANRCRGQIGSCARARAIGL
jgi:hypothetical protein